MAATGDVPLVAPRGALGVQGRRSSPYDASAAGRLYGRGFSASIGSIFSDSPTSCPHGADEIMEGRGQRLCRAAAPTPCWARRRRLPMAGPATRSTRRGLRSRPCFVDSEAAYGQSCVGTATGSGAERSWGRGRQRSGLRRKSSATAWTKPLRAAGERHHLGLPRRLRSPTPRPTRDGTWRPAGAGAQGKTSWRASRTCSAAAAAPLIKAAAKPSHGAGAPTAAGGQWRRHPHRRRGGVRRRRRRPTPSSAGLNDSLDGREGDFVFGGDGDDTVIGRRGAQPWPSPGLTSSLAEATTRVWGHLITDFVRGDRNHRPVGRRANASRRRPGVQVRGPSPKATRPAVRPTTVDQTTRRLPDRQGRDIEFSIGVKRPQGGSGFVLSSNAGRIHMWTSSSWGVGTRTCLPWGRCRRDLPLQKNRRSVENPSAQRCLGLGSPRLVAAVS